MTQQITSLRKVFQDKFSGEEEVSVKREQMTMTTIKSWEET